MEDIFKKMKKIENNMSYILIKERMRFIANLFNAITVYEAKLDEAIKSDKSFDFILHCHERICQMRGYLRQEINRR